MSDVSKSEDTDLSISIIFERPRLKIIDDEKYPRETILDIDLNHRLNYTMGKSLSRSWCKTAINDLDHEALKLIDDITKNVSLSVTRNVLSSLNELDKKTLYDVIKKKSEIKTLCKKCEVTLENKKETNIRWKLCQKCYLEWVDTQDFKNYSIEDWNEFKNYTVEEWVDFRK